MVVIFAANLGNPPSEATTIDADYKKDKLKLIKERSLGKLLNGEWYGAVYGTDDSRSSILSFIPALS